MQNSQDQDSLFIDHVEEHMTTARHAADEWALGVESSTQSRVLCKERTAVPQIVQIPLCADAIPSPLR